MTRLKWPSNDRVFGINDLHFIFTCVGSCVTVCDNTGNCSSLFPQLHEALQGTQAAPALHFTLMWLAICNCVWKFLVYVTLDHDFRTGLKILYAKVSCHWNRWDYMHKAWLGRRHISSTGHHIKPSPKGSGLMWWRVLRSAHLAVPDDVVCIFSYDYLSETAKWNWAVNHMPGESARLAALTS